MRALSIDNYVITTPLIEIINTLKRTFPSKKLKDVLPKPTENPTEILLTCVNSEHANGCEAHPDAHINITNKNVAYGTYHCFACNIATDFIGFIALYLDTSREFAKQWLIENFGELNGEAVVIDAPIVLPTNKNNYLSETLLDQYEHWCPYLAKRKISRDICEKFKVRYDPQYQQVIFPVYDIYGHLKMLAKRSINSKIFYLDKDQEKEVYGLNIIQKNNINECIITEGLLDCLSGWCNGVPTIATLGTISDYQIEQINKSCLTSIFTMFDNDSAGQKFTDIVFKKLSKRILVEQIKIPDPYKDLNELPREVFEKIVKGKVKIY